jgi:hypothetical protein
LCDSIAAILVSGWPPANGVDFQALRNWEGISGELQPISKLPSASDQNTGFHLKNSDLRAFYDGMHTR